MPRKKRFRALLRSTGRRGGCHVEIFAGPNAGVRGADQIANYGQRIGSRAINFRRSFERDPSDRNQGLLGHLSRLPQYFRADDRVGILLGHRLEYGTESDVVRGSNVGLGDMLERVSGRSQQTIPTANCGRFFDAQVFMAHMHASGACQQGNIRAVIHD